MMEIYLPDSHLKGHQSVYWNRHVAIFSIATYSVCVKIELAFKNLDGIR